MLNGKVVLITGGSGSFGKKFVEVILRDYPNVKKIIVGAIVLLIVIFLVIFFGFSKKTTKAVNIRLQRLVGKSL